MIGDVFKTIVATKLGDEEMHCVVKVTAFTEVCIKNPVHSFVFKEGLHLFLFTVVIECD